MAGGSTVGNGVAVSRFEGTVLVAVSARGVGVKVGGGMVASGVSTDSGVLVLVGGAGAVGVRLAVLDDPIVAVLEGIGEGVADIFGVGVGVRLAAGDGVGEADGVAVSVADGDGVLVGVADDDGVADGDDDGVADGDGDGDGDDVIVAEGLGVGVDVGVGSLPAVDTGPWRALPPVDPISSSA